MTLKTLTENKYTLNDIFVKNSEGWLAVALLMYPLAHFIHIIVFTFNCKFEELTLDEFAHFLTTKEFPGDYFVEIIEAFATLAIIIGVVGFISKLISEKRNHSFLDSDKIPSLFFIVFIILACVSVAINGITKELLLGHTQRGEGYIAILYYFFCFFVGSLIRKEKVKYAVLYFILGLGSVSASMTLVNEYIWEIPIVSHSKYCSIYYNVNFYAYFLTILIMLSAGLVLKDNSKGRKVFAFISLCLNSFVLAINNTFGCFVACFLAFIIMIIADSVIRKKFSFGALGLFGMFLAICMITSIWYDSFFTQIVGMFKDVKTIVSNGDNATDAGNLRWGLWIHTIKYIKEKPWIGFGFEGVCERLLKEAEQSKVHNEYLEYAADFGIPAALCYIGGLISIYIKALKKRAKIDGATFCALVGAFGYIGSAFFGNTMVFIAPLFFIVLGLANAIGGEEPDIIPSAAEESPVISSEVEKSDANEIDESDTITEETCHFEPAEESERSFDSLSLAQDDKSATATKDDSDVIPNDEDITMEVTEKTWFRRKNRKQNNKSNSRA